MFSKCNRPVLIHVIGKGNTIDHDYYTQNCRNSIVKRIWKQRKLSGTHSIKLLYGNARPHIHSHVVNYLTQEGINAMPHSPDLVPCDYWLNDYIKRNLTDQINEKSLARAISKIVKNIRASIPPTVDCLGSSVR